MNAKALLLLLPICGLQIAVAKSSGEKLRNQARTPVVSHIPHVRVISTGIASIGYSKRLHILEIEFVNGAVYRYWQVAQSVYLAFMTADSKARYYDKNVKGHYRSVKMRPRTKR